MKKLITLIVFALLAVPCMAQEQFVGIGGGVDLNNIESSTFDFTWGLGVGQGQYLATTMRTSGHYSDFTEDFLQSVVTIEPIKLEIVGIGSAGATTGDGVTKFNFGGGIGGIKDLSQFSEKLKGCGLFVGAKFMRNDFTTEAKNGGLSRIVVEFVYRWGVK